MPTTSAPANYPLTIDIAFQDPAWESIADLESGVRTAVETAVEMANLPHLAMNRPLELSIVLANDDLVHTLNRTYRNKDKPTNVLTFAALDEEQLPDPGGLLSLGDVILALETIQREAKEQNKPFIEHLTHLCVHGTLHLLGYDHIEENEATEMEMLEIKILSLLGIQNPYIDPLDME
jgi:probable rRNA maturation factor